MKCKDFNNRYRNLYIGLILSQVLLGETVLGRSVEYGGENRLLIRQAETSAGANSVSQSVPPVTVDSAHNSWDNFNNTNTQTSVPLTAQSTPVTASGQQKGTGGQSQPLPSLTTGADGTLHWQSQIIAGDKPGASGKDSSDPAATSTTVINSQVITETKYQVSNTNAGDNGSVFTTSTSQTKSTNLANPTQTNTSPKSLATTSVSSPSDLSLTGSPTKDSSQTTNSSDRVKQTTTRTTSGADILTSGNPTTDPQGGVTTTTRDKGTVNSTGAYATSQGKPIGGVDTSASTKKPTTEVTPKGSVTDNHNGIVVTNGQNTTSKVKETASDYHLTGPTDSASTSDGKSNKDLNPDQSTLTPTPSASNTGINSESETTYVSGSVTLTGQDAVAALAAQHSEDKSQNGIDTEKKPKDEGKGLSSIAIVGIVGGVLVAIVLLYLMWYQWRKKQIRKSLGEEISDDPEFDEDEKQRRQTRSSFGAEEPFTPLSRSGGVRPSKYGDDRTTYYSDRHTMAPTEWDEEHLYYNGHEEEETVTRNGRNQYGLTQYGEGMTAALAEDMYPGAPQTARTAVTNQDLAQNPFAPPPPVPRVPSVYNDTRGVTTRAADSVHTQPHLPHQRRTEYGVSMYDAYDGQDLRPQTPFSEPATSNLLPWLKKDGHAQAPPVLPVDPYFVDGMNGDNINVNNIIYEHDVPKAPPRAVMAQTPVAMGAPMGFQSELHDAPIPAFR
ncbi:uncharacterized protein L203_105201 [Cryptococcus depauperatus CBS 7841]|uniref:Uncharacterized protein n=1 Tax=Cryptococcus depauperatus CBS 7841 TaxID=1295531 RepID=A0AAJ8M3U1_9TREE